MPKKKLSLYNQKKQKKRSQKMIQDILRIVAIMVTIAALVIVSGLLNS